jgi:hypothetical protein
VGVAPLFIPWLSFIALRFVSPTAETPYPFSREIVRSAREIIRSAQTAAPPTSIVAPPPPTRAHLLHLLHLIHRRPSPSSTAAPPPPPTSAAHTRPPLPSPAISISSITGHLFHLSRHHPPPTTRVHLRHGSSSAPLLHLIHRRPSPPSAAPSSTADHSLPPPRRHLCRISARREIASSTRQSSQPALDAYQAKNESRMLSNGGVITSIYRHIYLVVAAATVVYVEDPVQIPTCTPLVFCD